MKISAGLLLNIIIAGITGRFANAQTQRYIIMHPDHINPQELLGETNIADITPLLGVEDRRWCVASLTAEQASLINSTLHDGAIVPDSEMYLPFEDTTTARRLRGTSAAENPPLLTDYPECKAHVDGIDMYVLDSVLYPNMPTFQGFDVKNEKSYVDENPLLPEPCHRHGSEVASVIVGKDNGVISSGDIKVRGIGIFGCDGRGFVSHMISGFQDALDHDQENKRAAARGLPLRRTIINLSGVSSSNVAVDTAVTAVYRKGIPIFVAAGNYGRYACNSQSPAQTVGVFAVGSTRGLGDQLALFSNYGEPCIRIYLPGSPVTVIHPITGIKIPASGTSFGSPIAAGLGAIVTSLNLQAPPDDIYASLMNRTITVALPDGSVIPSMQVMPKHLACPQQKILDSYTTTKGDNNKFNLWRSLNMKPLCFEFSAKFTTPKGWLIVGLRGNATVANAVVRMGQKQSRQSFIHRINGDGVAKATTKTRLVYQTTYTKIRVEQQDSKLLVSYYRSGQQKSLLALADNNQYSEVSFSAGGNSRVQYTNAVAC